MLEGLCGNKNIQKILIFLLVNGKCYGTQLHRMLNAPLTPLQKALLRLEKGGVIMSFYEGKTRLYQFNPSFPLLNELEQLLKKVYTLLPAGEKKNYYSAREERSTNHESSPQTIVNALWEKLAAIKKLAFHAKTRSHEEGVWNGKGQGEVNVTKENSNVLIFSEKGSWQGKQGGEVSFSNVFRWTLDRANGMIALEHLRRGIDKPVFLFHLSPTGKKSLTSLGSHLCEEDSYMGRIYFDRHTLRLSWRVIGPKKNEEIDYYYS